MKIFDELAGSAGEEKKEKKKLKLKSKEIRIKEAEGELDKLAGEVRKEIGGNLDKHIENFKKDMHGKGVDDIDSSHIHAAILGVEILAKGLQEELEDIDNEEANQLVLSNLRAAQMTLRMVRLALSEQEGNKK